MDNEFDFDEDGAEESVDTLDEEVPKGAGRWVELKMINNCGPYAYLRWREGGRTRSKYIGKVQEQ